MLNLFVRCTPSAPASIVQQTQSMNGEMDPETRRAAHILLLHFTFAATL
jgi:hypothetical protein